MTRPADLTRQSILRAAINLFAEKGFEGASVRDIVARAKVNQAAINYHFEGKEGLYAEVLKAALDALTRQAADAAALTDLPREAALRQFVYEQLRPLLHRDEAARYMRIFAWENVQPTQPATRAIDTLPAWSKAAFLPSLKARPRIPRMPSVMAATAGGNRSPARPMTTCAVSTMGKIGAKAMAMALRLSIARPATMIARFQWLVSMKAPIGV